MTSIGNHFVKLANVNGESERSSPTIIFVGVIGVPLR